MLLWFQVSSIFFSISNCFKCSEFYNQKDKVIYNIPLKSSNGTAQNETCNYEILAPARSQVEMLFDVYFQFPSRIPCEPNEKPENGIFISYTHGDNATYYDVICNNKSSYLVRSTGRRVYLKIIMSNISFSFRGVYHYVDPSNCIHFQCLNGGTCVAANGQRFCLCPFGLTGLTCSECSNFTCFNGGSCVRLSNNNPFCVCDIYYGGAHCEQNRNPCLSNPCLFGRCEITTSGKVRKVRVRNLQFSKYPRGLISKQLPQSDHTLSGHPGGILRKDEVEQWRCTCYPGYTGIRCDNKIDECASNSCSQERTCNDDKEQFSCSCNHCVFGLCVLEAKTVHCRCFPGFTGENCSQNIDECDLNPCINGDCVDFVNGYYCSCYMNFTGKTCNISLIDNVNTTNRTEGSVCSEQICEGGVCIEQNMVPTCRCFIGFNGTRCEIPVSILNPENTTFTSKKHQCFAKIDFENVCSCLLMFCQRNQNSTVCDVTTILSSLVTFCSTDSYSSICLSYIDYNSLLLLQYVCHMGLNSTNSSSSLDNNSITTREPMYGNVFSQLMYRLQCNLSNEEESVTVDVLPDETSPIDPQYLHLNSECSIIIPVDLLIDNCSLTHIDMYFKSSKIPFYFQSVFLQLTTADILKSSNTQQISKNFDFHKTFKSFIESEFVLIDNTTLSLNTSITGKALYHCQQKCSEDYCNKNCDLGKNTFEKKYRPRKESYSFCQCSKEGTVCNKTQDGNGYRSTDGTNDTTFYLIMTVTAILIIVIPGTAVVCIRRSKQRGETMFPDLMWHSAKVRPISLPKDKRNNRQLEAVDRGHDPSQELVDSKEIRVSNKSRVISLGGVETGKSEA